ncbi:MAG: hypothetical protein ACXVA2_24195 [Mucilaginibacter sp.]
MKLTLFEIIGNALSVGTLLQNMFFYFFLLLMIQIILQQLRPSPLRLRSEIGDDEL